MTQVQKFVLILVAVISMAVVTGACVFGIAYPPSVYADIYTDPVALTDALSGRTTTLLAIMGSADAVLVALGAVFTFVKE